MAGWLFKEEPDHYGFHDLERDGETIWDGVENALARQHLRQVRAGDRIWYYHTGKEKAIVGEMVAVGDAFADPARNHNDARAVVVRVRPVRRLPRPVTLRRIKEDETLANWELVRMARLSVMPVSADQWRRVEQLAREGQGNVAGADTERKSAAVRRRRQDPANS
jgi:predicted RNA-binding protein with PUA-like domain